ncbi:gamma-glutamylcyclotransferase family protein [Cognatishimia sp. F0-27]|uniref:gamma-glutamylcyclotransferase family protein n=1 Tax=Cognatishimia sp. F0-27 TaxID=2816855 RepID=UPI001D0CAD77|nr:gamma-glutamylcyclotransferase family protein [Cognatishimia sp. F0-27]MCC1493777.1 gamma-glutamylcyclotransferase [Cognatishimia sp. F0-27]
MKDTYFFGYGSLVNAMTHSFAPVHTARLNGWTRSWVATRERRVAYLTAIPSPGASIDGLIAPVSGPDWHSLDERERAYARHAVAAQVETGCDTARTIAVYAIEPDKRLPPSRDHPVLLSYLDVVIQGYLHRFGPDGAARFFQTTQGWDSPILDDRAAPQYPRAQTLTAPEQAFVDAHLTALKARIITD